MSATYGTGEQDTDGDDLRRTLLAGAPVTDSRQELAGIPTAVLTGGDGPPVVLLHGPGGFAAEWRQVIEDLVADHRVVVPDRPGHGTSGVGNGELQRPGRCAGWPVSSTPPATSRRRWWGRPWAEGSRCGMRATRETG